MAAEWNRPMNKTECERIENVEDLMSQVATHSVD